MLNRRHVLSFFGATLASARAFAQSDPHPAKQNRYSQRFADEGTSGTFFAVRQSPDSLVIADSDPERSFRAILPASTFKIANSIIALDTGIVADPDKDIFKWDGTIYAIPDWNRDHTLRTAIAASAVPVYQDIARRIGPERMQAYVDKFDYGNRNIGGGIDQFWLTGDMRISPMQQVTFVTKLMNGALPVSKRAQDLTRDILPVTKVGDSVIRAKSGLIGVTEKTARSGITTSVGWLVGWAEKGSARTPFALNLDIRDPKHIAARVPLATRLLTDFGAI